MIKGFNMEHYYIEAVCVHTQRIIRKDSGQYSAGTVKRLEEAAKLLKRSFIYAHRINEMLEGKDDETMFLLKLERDLNLLDQIENPRSNEEETTN